ncbi:MAG: hypothetical protein OSJ46_10585 [Duncaniella sp.]|nr:hypothetical protein [Duncaniella sp.]
MTLTISAALLLTLSVILAFIPSRWSVVTAWAGLTLTGIGSEIAIGAASYIFWGVAAAIVIALSYLLPPDITRSTRGNGYIVGATLAGALVGLVLSHAGMIVGAVLGAFCGALAYSRTPAGSALAFPSGKFLNYLCAKGLPAVITMCTVGTAIGILSTSIITR